MERALSEADGEVELRDFGFHHHEDTVFEVCDILIASEFQILPDAGGWLDQTEEWADDIREFLHLRAYVKAQKKASGAVDKLIHQQSPLSNADLLGD